MENTQKTAAPKKRNVYESVDLFLERTHTALTNAQSDQIAPLLAARGYSSAEIQTRLQEAEQLRRLHEVQKKEYGEQYEATEAFRQAREQAHDEYMDHIRLSRIVFRSDLAAQAALGLVGSRLKSQSGYISQGLQFYNSALDNPVHQDLMRQKGIGLEDLQSGRAAFDGLRKLTAAQQRETAEAQAATRARDAAFDALSEWMSDFYEIAKVALRRHPLLMEQLGMHED